MTLRTASLLASILVAASCGAAGLDPFGEDGREAFDGDRTYPPLLSPRDAALPYQLKVVAAFTARDTATAGAEPRQYWLDFHGLLGVKQQEGGRVQMHVQPCWVRWRSKSLDGDLISRKTFDQRDGTGAPRFKGFALEAELEEVDGRYDLVGTAPAAFVAGARIENPLDSTRELPVYRPAQPWQPANPRITDDDGDGKPGVTGKGRIYLVAGFEIQGAVWALARGFAGKLAASSDTAGKGCRVSGSMDLAGGLRAYGGSATRIDDIPRWIDENILKYQIDLATSFVMRPLVSRPPQRCQDLSDF